MKKTYMVAPQGLEEWAALYRLGQDQDFIIFKDYLERADRLLSDHTLEEQDKAELFKLIGARRVIQTILVYTGESKEVVLRLQEAEKQRQKQQQRHGG